MTLVNLYGAPCSGKSTNAFKICYDLKTAGKTVHLVQELATELILARKIDHYTQKYIFSETMKKIEESLGRVEYVICESPLHLNLIYCTEKEKWWIEERVKNFYLWCRSWYEVHDIYLPINEEKYSLRNRIHSLEEAREIDRKIRLLDIEFKELHELQLI